MRRSRSEAERPCSRAKGDRTTGPSCLWSPQSTCRSVGVEGEGEGGVQGAGEAKCEGVEDDKGEGE